MNECNGKCRNNAEHLERHAKDLGCMGEQFVKHDANKPDYSLIPPEVLSAMAQQLTMGALKYKPNNWKQGTLDRYYSAMMRHLDAIRMGEYMDEDNVPHSHAVLANAAFIYYLDYQKNKTEQREKPTLRPALGYKGRVLD